jgi:hypothetical protein
MVAVSERSSHQDIPVISVLRCALEELTSNNEGCGPTTEELFEVMTSKLPWLQSEEGPKHQVDILLLILLCAPLLITPA